MERGALENEQAQGRREKLSQGPSTPQDVLYTKGKDDETLPSKSSQK